MFLNEIRSTYNKALNDLSELAKKEMTPDTRSAFDAAAAHVEGLRSDLQRAERAEAIEQEIRSSNRPPRAQPGSMGQQADNAEERSAFENYIRYGTRSSELRSGIGVGPVAGAVSVTAGVAVPVGVGNVAVAQKSVGGLAAAVNQLVTDTGNELQIPLVDDTASDLISKAELANATEQNPVIAGATSTVEALSSGLIYISQELLSDSAFSVDALITQLFQTRLVNGLSKRIYNGTVGSFAAITANAPTAVTTAAATAITWSELTALYGSVDAAYRANASWVMSSLTHAYLMGIVNPATGQPILQPDVHGNPFGTLLGRPVVISENAPAIAAGAIPILFGDLSQYTLRTTRGIGVQRNDAVGFANDSVAFKLTVRAGGYSTSQASSPAIKGLKLKAS